MNSLRKSLFALCLLVTVQSVVMAQVASEPERGRLLNGLRVVLLPRPGEQEVLIKLRIHSGAAFDLSGKAGTMALLGDLLFPDPTTREYFTEEMKGRLNVATDYDSITITMQGRAREFERMIEILRTALVTTQLTPENVAKARDGRIKVIKETSISPGVVADRAIATRLFGDYPYGRPYTGTAESLERIGREDLLLARDRFLSPNNSTVVIVGGLQTGRVLRTLRQLLGGWRKNEQISPATFRQPTPPDSRALLINAPADQSVEIRLAVRGFARKDPDAAAAAMLGIVMRQRWEKLLPELTRSPVFVRHDSFTLPGIFVMGSSVDNLLAGKALEKAQEVIKSLTVTAVSASELDQARSETLAGLNSELSKPDGVAQALLDVDTYGTSPAAERISAINRLTPNDLQRATTRLFNDGIKASVVVGNSDLVKPQIERYLKVELMGELKPQTPLKSDSVTKPDTQPSGKPD
ncbi:MAG TPA: pitrilysin family protein [Pyrinomonadaceae bacterium]|nr:pitrilysin family protein [Pyrinomonadaceae bacterium]